MSSQIPFMENGRDWVVVVVEFGMRPVVVDAIASSSIRGAIEALTTGMWVEFTSSALLTKSNPINNNVPNRMNLKLFFWNEL
jgi:hypothetical protein